MRRIVNVLILTVVVGAAGYFGYVHRSDVQVMVRQLEAKAFPCRSPIRYSIGAIDSRFGISKSILIADLKEAETIWEKPSHKNLFEYQISGGDVVVNLVYDNRQAATDTLKTAGIQIEKSKSSYDALKKKYNSLSAQVQSEQGHYERSVAAYKSREAAYNAEVESWNKRGGAPKAAYEQLQQEKAALQLEIQNVKAEQAQLNTDIDTVNALATFLNQLIVQLNLNVQQYNQAGASQGEFEEGFYESVAGKQKIDIYEYSNHNALVRVLAHEMGHALGLNHVADPEAIMYKINQGTQMKLALDDTEALNLLCSRGINFITQLY